MRLARAEILPAMAILAEQDAGGVWRCKACQHPVMAHPPSEAAYASEKAARAPAEGPRDDALSRADWLGAAAAFAPPDLGPARTMYTAALPSKKFTLGRALLAARALRSTDWATRVGAALDAALLGAPPGANVSAPGLGVREVDPANLGVGVHLFRVFHSEVDGWLEDVKAVSADVLRHAPLTSGYAPVPATEWLWSTPRLGGLVSEVLDVLDLELRSGLPVLDPAAYLKMSQTAPFPGPLGAARLRGCGRSTRAVMTDAALDWRTAAGAAAARRAEAESKAVKAEGKAKEATQEAIPASRAPGGQKKGKKRSRSKKGGGTPPPKKSDDKQKRFREALRLKEIEDAVEKREKEKEASQANPVVVKCRQFARGACKFKDCKYAHVK